MYLTSIQNPNVDLSAPKFEANHCTSYVVLHVHRGRTQLPNKIVKNGIVRLNLLYLLGLNSSAIPRKF
eukprot:scaffold52493_cov55-Cyclotella_meneghiniana.AAC.1